MNFERFTHQAFWSPVPASNAPSVFGMPALVLAGGTATARTPSAGIFNSTTRMGFVGTGTTAGSVLSLRSGQSWLRSAVYSGSQGYGFWGQFAITDAAARANARMFFGLRSNTAALTNVDPATLTDCIGIGHNSGDTNMSIYMGGSSAAAPIPLGSGFPAQTLSTDIFDLFIASYPSGTSTGLIPDTGYVNWSVRCGSSVASGSAFYPSTGSAIYLPSTSTFLGFSAFRSNGTSTGAVSLDLFGLRMERSE